MENKRKVRESGIELLKILSMTMIVFAHVLQSVAMKSPVYPQFDSNVISMTQVTYDPSRFFLMFMWTFGWSWLGSFLVCSAWFMVDSKNFAFNKVMRIIVNVWIISVTFLVIFKVIGVQIPNDTLIKALLPCTFSVNWYITCYVILYLVHPFLNTVINSISQKTHLIIVLVSLFGYCSITLVFPNLLYWSDMIVFIVYYFVVAYVKRYMKEASNDIKTNLKFLFIPWIIDTLLKIVIDILGHKYEAFSDKMFMFNGMYSPLFIIMAIALFNLFRQIKFKNAIINYISGLMIWVYVIHENLLFRTYVRPYIWDIILKRFTNRYIVIEVISFATVLFWAAVIVACIYDKTVRKLMDNVADWISKKIEAMFDWITGKLM